MTHPTRSQRKANERRRKEAAAKQKPIPVAVQQLRAEANAAAHAERYPNPPRYDLHPQAKSRPTGLRYLGDRPRLLGLLLGAGRSLRNQKMSARARAA